MTRNDSNTAANSVRRRTFLKSGAAGVLAAASRVQAEDSAEPRGAQIAITLDLEMSRHYPRRGMTEWDYRKGDLDEATKRYALQAGELIHAAGGVIHYFLVGRVLEQPDVSWLRKLIEMGHSIGNHTYDHVNVKAADAAATQFRFQRAPWLVEGLKPDSIIQRNILLAARAMKQRLEYPPQGFRTPGGFSDGLRDKPPLQRWLRQQGYGWVSSLYPRFEAGKEREGPSQRVRSALKSALDESQPFTYPNGLIEIPMSPISDVHAFRSLRWSLPQYLQAIEFAVRSSIENNQVYDFLCHPSCMVVEDPDFAVIKRISQLVAESPSTKLCTLDEIAARHRSQAAAP